MKCPTKLAHTLMSAIQMIEPFKPVNTVMGMSNPQAAEAQADATGVVPTETTPDATTGSSAG